MDATRIRGLLPVRDVAMLEKPQQWIIGIGSLRGHDFPVIDVRTKLGIAKGTQGRQPCLVVVEAAGPRLIGFIADRVSQVLTFRDPIPASGTMRISGRTRQVFDPDHVLVEEVALNL